MQSRKLQILLIVLGIVLLALSIFFFYIGVPAWGGFIMFAAICSFIAALIAIPAE